MLKDKFELSILGGNEDNQGYVRLNHGKTYSIVLKSHWGAPRSDVQIFVDGKDVGTFRLNSGQRIAIERPVSEAKLFTFYKKGTSEYNKAEINKVSKQDEGVITAIFNVEKQVVGEVHTATPVMDFCCSTSYRGLAKGIGGSSAGGTGLSGHSSQKFVNVDNLVYDDAGQVKISLRLIADEEDIKPLKAAHYVPAPI